MAGKVFTRYPENGSVVTRLTMLSPKSVRAWPTLGIQLGTLIADSSTPSTVALNSNSRLNFIDQQASSGRHVAAGRGEIWVWQRRLYE